MLPSFLKPVFWSYDFSLLDTKKHKHVIVYQILTFGTLKMVQWLLENFSLEDIRQSFEKSGFEHFDRKNYSFWKTVLY